MRTIIKILAFVVIAILIAPQYAQAQNTYEFTRNYEYIPSGDYDSEQNRLNPTHRTNYDTWDPIPIGVYVGGYSRESIFRSDIVPDDNCSIALAQVTKFRTSSIMSGSSNFLVRTPTFGDNWTAQYLSIYRIERETRWTFEENSTFPGGYPSAYNELKINFTAGNWTLIHFSWTCDPTDLSPTDGNAFFLRSGRSYIECNAPIWPDTYYLFVTHVDYAPDAYVEFTWSPETLTGDWNLSTYAQFNLVAPDSPQLDQWDVNASLGYSFDFREGMAQSVAAFNEYFEDGDNLHFYRKMDNLDLAKYPTIMIPFESSLSNVSITLTVRACHFNNPTDSDVIILDTTEYNDFILFSSSDSWATLLDEPWENDWEGWLKFTLTIGNDTRIRLYLRDYEYDLHKMNQSWEDRSWFGQRAFVHSPGYEYYPENFVHFSSGVDSKYYHFRVQHVVQSNDYYWQQGIPPGDRDLDDTDRDFWDLNIFEQIVYMAGDYAIDISGILFTLHMTEEGHKLHTVGTRLQMIALSGELPSPIGFFKDIFHIIWQAMKAFGKWIYRVAQAVVGAISWLVDGLVYYGSILLAMLIVIAAFFVLFFFAYFSLRFSMAIKKAILGDLQGASDEFGKAGATARRLVGRGP